MDATGAGRRWLGNLLLLLAGLAAALLAAEAGARWLLSRPPVPYPQTVFAGEDLIQNSLGFRDFEYTEAKPPGVFRVIAVGDSFTHGAGVAFDDVYTKRLERYLNEYRSAEGVTFQVLGMGTPGLATPHEVRRIKDEAVRFQADLVVLGYVLNDAEDEDDHEGMWALRAKHHYDSPEERARAGHGWLADRSALVRLVATRLEATKVNRGQIAFYDALYREGNPGWRKTRDALAELAAFSRERKLPVVVLLFPLVAWELDDRYPFRHIHDLLHREFRKDGLTFLDLLPAYRGLPPQTLSAIPFRDPHPSEVGHRIATERLYLFLRKRDLLPKGEGRLAAHMRDRRIPPPRW